MEGADREGEGYQQTETVIDISKGFKDRLLSLVEIEKVYWPSKIRRARKKRI
jgi:hypothetical protein|eukprot:SAG22_NODE_2_length_61565_cov_858.782010_53_plen_52_part_00